MKLRVLPDGDEIRATIGEDGLVVGRDEDCDLVLEDERISTRHARFDRLPDGRIQLRDLGSTNGSFLNDRRLEGPVMVKRGERLRFGRTTLEVVDDGRERATTASPTPEAAAISFAHEAPKASLSLRGVASERVIELAPGSYVIGRGSGCDIVLHDERVSTTHARLDVLPDGDFRLHDLGSSNGTFLNGEKLMAATSLSPGQEFRCGGTFLTVSAPGEVLGEPIGPEQANTKTRLGGLHSLRIVRAGHILPVDWNRTLSVGRDAGCDITLSGPAVSRRHAQLEPTGPQSWLLRDVGSAGGIFVGGKRVQEVSITDKPVTLWIGPVGDGERITILPPGTNPPRAWFERKGLVAAAAAAVLLVALAAFGFAFLGRETPSGTASDGATLDHAKRATVRISEAMSLDEIESFGWGSGSIIEVDGRTLILTNAHVAAPDAPGVRPLYGSWIGDPAELYTVFTYIADDQPAAPKYRARVVAADGWMDLALLEIVQTIDGASVDPDDVELPTVSLGDSRGLATGESLHVLGFPGLVESDAVDVQTGQFASPHEDSLLNDPRGWLNVSGAIRITGGNSGGMAIDSEGLLVGVPSAGKPDTGSNEDVGRLRPVHLLNRGLLDAAISGTPYDQFQYVTQPTGQETAQATGWVEASDAIQECSEQAVTSAVPGTLVAAQFSYSAMSVGQHVFFGFTTETGSGRELVGELGFDWPDELGSEGCVGIAMAPELTLPAGTYSAEFRIGPSYETILAEQTITFTTETDESTDTGGGTGEGDGGTGPVTSLEEVLNEFPQCARPAFDVPEAGGGIVDTTTQLQTPYYQWACVVWSTLVTDPYPVNEEGFWMDPGYAYEWLLNNVDLAQEDEDLILELHAAWIRFLEAGQ